MQKELYEKCSDNLKILFEKYKDNEYILNKISNYINNVLPIHIENDIQILNKRNERYDRLLENSQEFIQKFLNLNNYYYCTSSELFFNYDNIQYTTYKEDSIIYEICNLINKNEILLPWKHKIKFNIMKEIRERNIYDAIPETDTIKDVITCLMNLFMNNKYMVKYFLIIIGDIILKKNETFVYLIDSNVKKIIKLLSNVAYEYFGSNNFSNFKYKYHELHKNCRIIQIDKNIINNNFSFIENSRNNKNNLLNLFIVAIHYSKRYENGEHFLMINSNLDLINNVTILNNNENFVNIFLTSMIEKCNIDETNIISGKGMHYLWKLFLIENNFPNIFLLNVFKILIRKYITYDETKDNYIGVISKKLPYISQFLQFWNSTIILDNMDTVSEMVSTLTCIDNSLKISEIIMLFRYWLNKNNYNTNSHNLKEQNIIELIKHFFENVIIDDDKYINNIKSIYWDKNKDICQFLEYIKNNKLKNNQLNYNNYCIKITNLFSLYCKYAKVQSLDFTIDKNYFEKFVYQYLQKYIDNDNLINIQEWLLS